MTIALAMIIRDEAPIIERCLQSTRALIDSYVLVDTGSTDGTMNIARRTLEGIPGEIYERPWVSFGHNRSELMALARGRADWLLLLDADMTLEYEGVPTSMWTRLPLDLDAAVTSYQIRHASEPEYWIKRLVDGNRRWLYIGATHEYITTAGEDTTRRLDGLAIHHHHDGAYRKHKFERDLDLLAKDHERDPGNTRTTFYLANTLRDLGRNSEAVETYLQRADMGGWEEEVFYSLYEAGRLDRDVSILFRAWAQRPQRVEPLYQLARIFREREQWEPAHLIATRALHIPIPDDTLFLHRWMYEWGVLFEYSISSWWVGEIDEARDASDRLLAIDDLPEPYHSRVLDNRRFLPEDAASRDGKQ